MRRWILSFFVAGPAALLALASTSGQERVTTQAPQTVNSAATKAPDVSRYGPLQKQVYLCAQRGADWLVRMNGTDGRFVNGYVTALKTGLEGDHYLRQVGAAFALARAARFTGDQRQAARARQATLTLLADTALEGNPAGVRATTFPSALVNRLSAAGMLVQTICELPNPADDLLEQSEQVCAYIRSRQQADGSFRSNEAGAASAQLDENDINYHAGHALYGLMLSQRLRPAPWKLDAARKALAFHLPWWRAHKNLTFVPPQAAAYAEAYLATGEKPFADAVVELTDWLAELQYPLLDPRHPLWGGGFMSWTDGKPTQVAPTIGSALYAESLAEGCRVARKLGDVARYHRYREAVERGLQFLAGLQFTDANTLHFAEWYRPYLTGAFHASHQDGNIRIDYTQHAVSALVQYLAYVAD